MRSPSPNTGKMHMSSHLLERLAALISPPRKHQTCYRGVDTPSSRFQGVVKHLGKLLEIELLCIS